MYFNESQKTMYNLQMISKLVEIASSSNIFSHVHSVLCSPLEAGHVS